MEGHGILIDQVKGHQKCPSKMIVLTSLSLRPALPGVTVGTVLPTIQKGGLKAILSLLKRTACGVGGVCCGELNR